VNDIAEVDAAMTPEQKQRMAEITRQIGHLRETYYADSATDRTRAFDIAMMQSLLEERAAMRRYTRSYRNHALAQMKASKEA
jgi:hypothetical protein